MQENNVKKRLSKQNNKYTKKSLRAQSVTLCEDNCTRRQVKAKAKLKIQVTYRVSA